MGVGDGKRGVTSSPPYSQLLLPSDPAIRRADIHWISAATLLPVPTDRERDAPAPIPDVTENFSSGGRISALRITGSDLYNGPRRGVRFHLLSAFFTA